MTAVVILGMHRSGTSLVSSILQALGVHIGDELGGPESDNQWGHFEDHDFVQMNADILESAGGDWANVPSVKRIAQAATEHEEELRGLVDGKQANGHDLWGWKDPRTCLTADCYHNLLDDPRYLVVRRDRPDVVASLNKRNGEGPWELLYLEYWQRIGSFLLAVDSPVMEVRFEDLTHPIAGPRAVRKIARFLHVNDEGRIREAMQRIHMRDRWGFGSIGIGTPYYKAKYDFFRWWSWILVGGLETGDQLLNSQRVRCEVPIPLSHNALVVEFLMHTTRDTLCLIEDDHVGPQDIINQMRHKAENQAFDIVCASYVNRRGPTTAVGFNFMPEGPNEYGEWDCLLNPFAVTETGTQEYDGAALGLVLVRRWVLEAMMGNSHPDEYFWFDWRGRNSQDIQFYAKAKHGAGARTGVDRDNDVGHISARTYTMRDFFERRAEAAAERAEQFRTEDNKTEVVENG